MYHAREIVEAGGLMCYGATFADAYRLAAPMPAEFSRVKSLGSRADHRAAPVIAQSGMSALAGRRSCPDGEINAMGQAPTPALQQDKPDPGSIF
jgi:hypothetical protein